MIVCEFPDIQAVQGNKMGKRSSIFFIYLRNRCYRSEWSQCHMFLLKHHTFICARCVLAESVTLSGLTENFPWIFAISLWYLAFLKFEDSVVYRFKISGCKVAVFVIACILIRCLSFTFLLYNFSYSKAFIKNYERVSSETTESNMFCFLLPVK